MPRPHSFLIYTCAILLPWLLHLRNWEVINQSITSSTPNITHSNNIVTGYMYIPIWRNIKVNHRSINYIQQWSDIKPAIDTDYKLTFSKIKKEKCRRSNRHQQRFCVSGNILIITRLLVLYQIYNHLTLRCTALVLGDYKSDIALIGVL